MADFKITNKFKGYITKPDKTNIEDGILVNGSQNVLFNDGERIVARQGYTLDGASNASLTPVESSYDWDTSTGVERNLRSYDDELEVRILDGTTVTWTRVLDGWTSVDFNFATYWDVNEVSDILLFVAGDANVYSWSGGLATLASSTVNTLTKNGTETWAEARFVVAGTDYDKTVTINGTTYTYTGGEGTTTLTGVTPDPSGEAANSDVIQKPTTHTSVPASGVTNDLIEVLNNQVWYGSLTSGNIYVSKINDFNNVTFSALRAPGEGALIRSEAPPTAFITQENSMYISAGKDRWYRDKFTLSSDQSEEQLTIERLKTTSQEAAISQSAVAKIKNNVVFLNNEPTLDTLGRLENINTPQSKPLSDPIKPDFDVADFTNVHIKYFRNNIYIAIPNDSVLLIYNLEKGFWEAPQVFPFRRLSIIGGELYAHSANVPETYKLFDGYNDNEAPINAIASFSYQNYGTRTDYKNFDEWFTEGYIQTNTLLTEKHRYDFEGSTSVIEKKIDGSTSAIIFNLSEDGSLGKKSLGKLTIGGKGSAVTDTVPPKFRVIKEMVREDFWEHQIEYSSNGVDQRWELLAYGPNVEVSRQDNNPIKE